MPFSKNQFVNSIKKRSSYFFYKTFFIFLIVFTVFAFSVISITYSNLKNREIKSQKDNYAHISESVSSQLDLTMKEMSNLSIYIALSYSSNNTNSTSKINQLMPYIVPTANKSQRLVIDSEREFRYFGIPVSISKTEDKAHFNDYKKKFADIDDFIFLKPHEDFWAYNPNKYLFSCIRKVPNQTNSKQETAIWVQRSAADLQSILAKTSSEELMIIDENAYSIPLSANDSSRFFPNVKIQNNSDHTKTWYAKDENNIDCYYIAKKLAYNDWTLLLEVEKANLMQPVNQSVLPLIILFILLYSCIIPIIYFSTKHSAKPLNKLRRQIDKINFDDFEITTPSPFFEDEIEALNDALDKMMIKLNQAANEKASMYSREIHASFLALQAQINPHFLYNALQVFIALADTNQNEVLSEALYTFSNSLRYLTSSSPSIIPVKSEIAHIQNYLSLMQLIKGEQLKYTIEIDDDINSNLETFLVPKMSLQPLIENAFKHGFSQVLPPWILKIKIEADQNNFKIYFYNNGVGMNQEDIDELLLKIEHFLTKPIDFLENLKIGGMGLISCLSRFKNIYQDRFHFEIKTNADITGFSILLLIEKES